MEDIDGLKPKSWNKDDAYSKIAKYCDYQERSSGEVRTKLFQHAIYGPLQEEIINRLIAEDIISDQRYAMAYVRGKFRINGWGKNKISNELKFDKIPNSIIQEALAQIDDEDYFKEIKKEILKKSRILKKKEKNESILKKKVIAFMIQRGFGYSDVIECYNSGV